MKTCKKNKCPSFNILEDGKLFDPGDTCCIDCSANKTCYNRCHKLHDNNCEFIEDGKK